MAEKKQKPKLKPRDLAIKLANRLFIALNVLVFFLIIYQVVNFFEVYSKRNGEMFDQGRLVNIKAKTNEASFTDISDAEINKQKQNYDNRNNPDYQPDVEEDFIGPMPLKSETTQDATKPILLDYNSANLAVIITEIGMKQSELDEAKVLPKEVTFAFSPYSDELQKKINAAKADGRETLLNIMMQPSSFPLKDNGPFSIQANYDESEAAIKFNSMLATANGYRGLLATNDEVVTSKFEKLSPILKRVSEKSLIFGYFRSTSNINVENDAKPLAADVFGIDYLIDNDANEDAIIKNLNQVKEDLLVRKKRVVIAIHPYPISISILKKWLDQNANANIQIAPVSYFVTNN